MLTMDWSIGLLARGQQGNIWGNNLQISCGRPCTQKLGAFYIGMLWLGGGSDMRLFWWRKKEPAPDEADDEVVTITITPRAGLLHEMFALGFSPDQIVWLQQQLEVTEARVRAETAQTPSAAKPRNRRNQQPKRNRADYMRKYRSNRTKLRVVTDNGGEAA